MNSTKATARRAGFLYLALAIIAPFSAIYIPSVFFVRGDATATAHNITAGELLYRVGILSGLVNKIVFLFLVLSLYSLFKDVDKKHARLMVALVAVSVAIGLVNLLNKMAPLVLLGGDDFLSEFTKPQLHALALGFLRFGSHLTHVAMAFWGLWLFPFGILVIRSGFFPKVLGILLMLAGFAYLTTSATSIVLPAYRQVVSQIMMPLYFAELPIIIWLLVKGAKVPPSPTGIQRDA